MKNIFILSYNKLGFSFWKSHLNIADDCNICEFRSGQECIKNLNLKPDVVVVDDYFAIASEDDLCGSKVVQIIEEIQPNLRCFHVSPINSGKEWSLEKQGVVSSNMNADLIHAINICVQTKRALAT